jgi:ABC-2 type transport system permease protein
MNKLPILLRRELWEHRNTFLILPFITTCFFLLIMLLLFTAGSTDSINIQVDMDMQNDGNGNWVDEKFESDDMVAALIYRLESIPEYQREQYVKTGLHSMTAPLMVILWGVVFFYLLNTLYEDRRDRSILFWKSLPVSDLSTVVSKLIMGLIVVPLVYLVGVAVLQFSGLLLLTFGTIGTEIDAWPTIWAPSNLLLEWLGYISLLLFYVLWTLPFYGWLMAVSAVAKSVPLAWVLGIPIAVSILEGVFTRQSSLAHWMAEHTFFREMFDGRTPVFEKVQAHLFSLNMLSAIVVGAGLIGVAIYLRGKADEL